MSTERDPQDLFQAPSEPRITLGSAPDTLIEIAQRARLARRTRPKHLRTPEEAEILWAINTVLALLDLADQDDEDNPYAASRARNRIRRAMEIAIRLGTSEELLRDVEKHMEEHRRLSELDGILPAARRDVDPFS